MSAGTSLCKMGKQKPLIHQIANYVVMNETANATLALGALPVMAHAIEEVEEMVGSASALVLNIGTLSARWIEALLVAGLAANKHGVPVVLDPVGAGATRFRTENAKQTLDEVDIAVLRANPGKVAALVGVTTEMRGVESIGAGESAARDAKEPGSFHVNLYDALAALALNADGVHLGQCDPGAEIARERGLILDRSATTFKEAKSRDADFHWRWPGVDNSIESWCRNAARTPRAGPDMRRRRRAGHLDWRD